MTELNNDNFESEVLKAQGAVLVDFYGERCVSCVALMPHIEELCEKYGDKIKFCALNTTKARRLALSQKVLGLPVVAIYKDGVMLESCAQDQATPENVEAMVKRYALGGSLEAL